MLRRIGVPVLAILLFLALWEAIVWLNGWPNYVMASPSDLPTAYARFWNLFLLGGWQTLWRTVAGLAIAVVVGTLLGMVMGFSRIARDALYPLLVGFNAVPKATLVPVLSLLLPEAAARLLRWRASTLDAARERADVLGLKGATFAWRTIDGHEASAYWPARNAASSRGSPIRRAGTPPSQRRKASAGEPPERSAAPAASSSSRWVRK